jgi:hypothetical protein
LGSSLKPLQPHQGLSLQFHQAPNSEYHLLHCKLQLFLSCHQLQ